MSLIFLPVLALFESLIFNYSHCLLCEQFSKKRCEGQSHPQRFLSPGTGLGGWMAFPPLCATPHIRPGVLLGVPGGSGAEGWAQGLFKAAA